MGPGMPGGGTPRPIQAPAAPRVDNQGLDQALATMARIAEQTEASNKATAELIRHLERVQRGAKDVERTLDGWDTDFTSIMRNSANLQYTMARIKKLQGMRVGGGSSRQGTADYIQQLQKEYKILLQVLNTGKGQGRYVKEVDKALRGLDTTLKRVKKTNDATWDSQQIEEVNAALRATAASVGEVQRAMSKVQVQKMTAGFHELRKTVDDAFGGRFDQTLRRIPGIAKIMDAQRFKRQSNAASEGLAVLASKRQAMRQEAWKGAARTAVKTHGAGAMTHLRSLGYQGPRPIGAKGLTGPLRGSRIPTTVPGAASPTSSAVARAGGSLEQMSVKTMVVQQMVQGKQAAKELARSDAKAGRDARFNPKTGKLLDQAPAAGESLAEATGTGLGRRSKFRGAMLNGLRNRGGAPVSMEDVQGTVAGKGGNALSRGFNNLVTGMAEGGGWKGKLAKGLLSRGAGSAAAGVGQAGVGAGSSLLSGGMKLASRAAVPLAIVGALISARDKIIEENKKMQESMGGLGIHGKGEAGVNFHGVRKSLLSTGLTKAALMGQGLAENQKIMETIGESGMAPGRSLRRGLDLGAAVDDRNSLQGNGFYGSIMKNAMFNGKNLGMGQDQSVRLTLKLVEKFGKTMQATQEFFVGMDDMMESSGVTASKYIEIIDGITDQFNDMNRSLTHTVSLLTTVGKNGRLTGDAMQEMAKGLTGPNQMSMAQRMFSVQGMTAADRKSATDSLNAGMDRDMDSLAKSLQKAGVNVEAGDIPGKRQEIEMQLAQNLKDQPEELKVQVDNLEKTMNRYNATRAQTAALGSNNPLAVASAVEMGGSSGTLAMYEKQSTLKRLAGMAKFSQGDTQKLLANDPAMVQRLMSSGVVSVAKQSGVLQGDFDVVGAIQAQGQARRSGALSATTFGREAGSIEDLLKGPQGQERYDTMLALQKARVGAGLAKGRTGKDANNLMVQDFMEKAKKGNGGELMKELETLDETFKQVTSVGSAMEKALQADVDAKAKEQARAKAEKIMAETRPMAEIFAKSFEYLFEKVINMLDKMMYVLSPGKWFGKLLGGNEGSNNWVDDRVTAMQDISSRIDASKLSEQDRKTYDQIQTDIKAGTYTSGDNEAKDKKTHEGLKALHELATKTGVGGQSESVQRRLWAAQGATNVGFRYEETTGDGQGGAHTTTSRSNPLASYESAAAVLKDAKSKGASAGAVGEALLSVVNGKGTQGGDQIMGAMEKMGKWNDIVREQDKATGNWQLVAKSAEAASILDEMAKTRSDSMSAGKKNQDGTTTYNVFTTPINTTPAAPADAAKGANKPPATPVKKTQ